MPDEAGSKKQPQVPPRRTERAPSESLETELAALEAMLPPAKAARPGQRKTAPVDKKGEEGLPDA